MQESQFHNWLIDNEYDERTISSRLSNCRRIEMFEGDLDDHFNKDSGVNLSNRLQYSTQDQKNSTQAKHSIPINGNIYNGTATFRSAASLYFKFRSSGNSKKLNLDTKTIIRRNKIKPSRARSFSHSKKADTPENKISRFESFGNFWRVH